MRWAWWRGAAGIPDRPRSGNGSSSFHLWWQSPPDVVVAASVELEVLGEPLVDDLYFWALQASFGDGRGTTFGAAHLGLQWNRRHPGRRAANWGGYGNVGDVRSVLRGTPSVLPSTPDDPNTRDFPWVGGRPYRLVIDRGEQGWRGSVVDPHTGEATVVREVLAGGDRLSGLVMWSEVFAPCTAPATSVRWSRPQAVLADGTRWSPAWASLTFPADGCPNTEVEVDARGVLQHTGTTRTARAGQRVRFPPVNAS